MTQLVQRVPSNRRAIQRDIRGRLRWAGSHAANWLDYAATFPLRALGYGLGEHTPAAVRHRVIRSDERIRERQAERFDVDAARHGDAVAQFRHERDAAIESGFAAGDELRVAFTGNAPSYRPRGEFGEQLRFRNFPLVPEEEEGRYLSAAWTAYRAFGGREEELNAEEEELERRRGGLRRPMPPGL